MGQYWYVVNLDKREFINPHDLGSGLKLSEQLSAYPGPGAALIVLCAAMPEPRGGGDLDMDKNWHGPERTFLEHNTCPGPMPEEYPEIARRTIGRWAGDRIAVVGDYAERSDLPDVFQAENICGMCGERTWPNISADVAAVIEHELGGKFTGDGWRRWEEKKLPAKESKEPSKLLTAAKGCLGYLEALPKGCRPDQKWLVPLREAIQEEEVQQATGAKK